MGYRLVREPVSSEYGGVVPLANYTPWNVDAQFLETYQAIRKNTLVDISRCWELWTLAGQTAKLAPGMRFSRSASGAAEPARSQPSASHWPDSRPPFIFFCDTHVRKVW